VTTIVPAAPNTLIISVEYDPTGLSWAKLTDHTCLGWRLDDTGLPMPAQPMISDGMLPGPPADTGVVLSPSWVECINAAIVAPGVWRGSIAAFFDWLSGNGGASRKLETQLAVSPTLRNEFDAWAGRNPDLVYQG
jgi:hypothetical protein